MQEKNKTSVEEGAWQGCVVGMYPENGNVTLLSGDERKIDGFEATIAHEVGAVIWSPTWDDEFPTKACRQLHDRGIIPHLTWELFLEDAYFIGSPYTK